VSKRALITGAAGFVGANLVRRLVQDGHDVHVVVHPESDLWRLEGLTDDATLHRLDLEDRESVQQAVGRVQPDWIFHAAAHGAYPHQRDLRTMIATNVVGTVNLVEAAMAAGFESFVHTGTSSEYGVKDHGPTEDELPEPNSHYAVTKVAATLYCRHMARAHGAGIRVLRLYSVYGPWEEPTRLMPRVAVRGLRGAWPPMANPATARDYVHADDVVEAYLAAASVPDQEPGAIYNIGTGVQTSLRDVTEIARRQLSIAVEPTWGSMPDRIWDAGVWLAAPSAARTSLGWSARLDLATGFSSFVSWLRERPALLRRYEQAGAWTEEEATVWIPR